MSQWSQRGVDVESVIQFIQSPGDRGTTIIE